MPEPVTLLLSAAQGIAMFALVAAVAIAMLTFFATLFLTITGELH